MKWVSYCNGGPNNTTVGQETDSLGKACGSLEAMMKNLGATIGHIYRSDQNVGKFVETEAEADIEE